MVEVEVRKVQRLGASSLVITLPHFWVKKVNLKPGDSVMIVDEGLSLRLTPVSKVQNSKAVKVDLKGVRDSRVLNMLIPCLYILGYDEVNVKLIERNPEILSHLKNAMLKLPGLEVVDLGGDTVTAKILLDSSRVDLKASLRGMTILTSNIVKTIARAVRGGFTEDIKVEVKSLSEELYRLRSIVERQLHIYPYVSREDEDLNPILALTALALLSLMDALLLDVVDVAGVGFKASEELSSVLDRLGDIVPLIGSAIVNPSVKRSVEMLEALQRIQGDVVNLIKYKALEELQYVVATRIADFIKILQIICYAITCIGLSRGGES